MTEPSDEQVRDLLDSLPRLPPERPSMGNVICAQCWSNWLADNENWQAKPVRIVTIHNGQALCEDHFREVKGLPARG